MRRIVVGVGGIALVTLLFGGLMIGVGSAQSADSGTNASFGADVSSFMQASGAEAEGELDDEMFDAALNRTKDSDERRALLEDRRERLEERHRTLREQRQTLDGESSVRTHAVATRVAVGASGLERSVNDTETAALDAGVDTGRLDEIRSNTSELRGREVAELARGLGSGSTAPDRGPPDDVPEENRTEQNQTVNESDTPPESAANRPIEGDNRPSDAHQTGRPETSREKANESREDTAGESESAGEDNPPRPPGDSGPEIQIGSDNESAAEPRNFNGSDRDRGVSVDIIP